MHLCKLESLCKDAGSAKSILFLLPNPKSHKIYLFYFIFQYWNNWTMDNISLDPQQLQFTFRQWSTSSCFNTRYSSSEVLSHCLLLWFPYKCFTGLCNLLFLNLFCAIYLPSQLQSLGEAFLPWWSIIDFFLVFFFFFMKLLVVMILYNRVWISKA